MDSRPFTIPRERLAALADDGRFDEHAAHSPSTHLARYGIAAQDDDGVVTASVRIHGQMIEAIVQDAAFLRGSVGQQHARKMSAAVARARAARRTLL
ncbi:MAG: carboxyl transferase domain-containing protein, partial [Casimicrobiaceae bacterium]